MLPSLCAAALAVAVALAPSPTPSPSASPEALHTIVTVTVGTKTLHPLVTLPVQADRIGHEQIATSPGQTVEGALDVIPGYAQAGTNSWFLGQHSNYADLRGLGPGSMLVLFDGVPINDPLGSWVSWSRVPKLAVGAIEVAHGGASSLYGSAALGGVMSIETVQPTKSAYGLDVFTGNLGTSGSALALSQRIGKHAGLVTYVDREQSKGYIDGYGANSVDPTHPFASYDGQRVMSIAHFGTAANGELDAGFLSTQDHRQGNYAGPQYYYGREGFVRFRRDYGGGTGVQAVAYDNNDSYVFDRYAAYGGPYALTGTGSMELDTVGFVASATRTLGDVTFLIGQDFSNVAGSRDEMRFTSPSIVMSGIQQFAGTFAQADLQLDKFEAIGGVRYDTYSQRQAFDAEVAPNPGVTPLPANALHHVSPRFALRYTLAPRFNLRASYANAFKAPAWGSLYSEYPIGGGAQVVGNPSLKAMTVDEKEIGFDWTPDYNTRIYATLYSETMNDRAILALTAPLTYANENVSLARDGGYELSIQRALSLHASVLASYANAPSRITDPQNPSATGNVIPEQPQKTGTLAFRLFDDRQSLEVEARQIGRAYYDEANTQPIGGVTLYDAHVAHSIGRLGSLYVDVQNLFNRRWHADNATYAPPRLLVFGIRRDLP